MFSDILEYKVKKNSVKSVKISEDSIKLSEGNKDYP